MDTRVQRPCEHIEHCEDGWIDRGVAQIDFFPEGHMWEVCPFWRECIKGGVIPEIVTNVILTN